MKTSENFDKFIAEYATQFENAAKKYPNEYRLDAPVSVVVERMKIAFIKKTFNKEGRAIKATCKALNIGYTYRDIETYLGYNEL